MEMFLIGISRTRLGMRIRRRGRFYGVLTGYCVRRRVRCKVGSMTAALPTPCADVTTRLLLRNFGAALEGRRLWMSRRIGVIAGTCDGVCKRPWLKRRCYLEVAGAKLDRDTGSQRNSSLATCHHRDTLPKRVVTSTVVCCYADGEAALRKRERTLHLFAFTYRAIVGNKDDDWLENSAATDGQGVSGLCSRTDACEWCWTLQGCGGDRRETSFGHRSIA